MLRWLLCLLPAIACAAGTVQAAIPDALSVPPIEATVLATLRPGHPRLLLLPSDIARIKASIAADPTAKGYYDALRQEGTSILTQKPVVHKLIGPRLLDQSRRALERIYTLALLYRLDGDRKWADRAIVEMRTAAAFADWNPSHFLDVAEMTHALAVGYDWLYDVLSSDDRAVIKTALIEKGLREYEKAFRAHAWWVGDRFNWNNVCSGGAIVGALAVADEESALARWLLVQSIHSLPAALGSYAPDGAWAEGPAYWGYATKYTILAFAALDSALGTDFGLSRFPGLAETGRFRMQSVGPTGLFFNFADAGDKSGDEPSLFWLARRYDDPLLAWGARQAAGRKGSARDLMWYDARGSQSDQASFGLDSHYSKAQVAFFRSSWTDPNALYVGFKGGDNKANHSHLDLGTFVLDALGQRWAIDLGSDDYNLPGYFDTKGQRWTYYRLGTPGHNTLTLDGRNQDPEAAAPLTTFHSSSTSAQAIADLSAAYARSGAVRVRRGVALVARRSEALIQDEIQTANPVETVWAIHTKAEIGLSPDGRQATLTQGGQTLSARLLAPADARFTVESIAIPPPQHPAPDVRKLLVRLPEKTSSAQIAVLFAPTGAPKAMPRIVSLDDWAKSAPGR